jgi:hypothetical protein
MAKVRWLPKNLSEGALTVYSKRPSLQGGITFQVDGLGRLYARRKPNMKGVRFSDAFRSNWDFIRYSTQLYKITHAYFLEQYNQQALGLWLQPRDIWTAAVAGRLWYFELEDGKKLFPMAARVSMSQSLDILSQEPGSILVRGNEFWLGLTPGTVGHVLTVLSPGVIGWAPVPGLAEGLRTYTVPGVALQGTGQGGGSTSLPYGRRGVTLVGTAASSLSYMFESLTSAHTVGVRIGVARTGTDGGDYRFVLYLYELGDDGVLLSQTEVAVQVAAPQPGSELDYDFPSVSLSENYSRRYLSVVVLRSGASPLDTNNSHCYVSFLRVTYV